MSGYGDIRGNSDYGPDQNSNLIYPESWAGLKFETLWVQMGKRPNRLESHARPPASKSIQILFVSCQTFVAFCCGV